MITLLVLLIIGISYTAGEYTENAGGMVVISLIVDSIILWFYLSSKSKKKEERNELIQNFCALSPSERKKYLSQFRYGYKDESSYYAFRKFEKLYGREETEGIIRFAQQKVKQQQEEEEIVSLEKAKKNQKTEDAPSKVKSTVHVQNIGL